MDMKAFVIEKPGTAMVKTMPIPAVGDDDIRIKVKASGICGTDVHIYRGDYLGTYPVIPGHEFSGVVDAVGSKAARIKIGDRVAVEPNIVCDNCFPCLNNRQNYCDHWGAAGVTMPGGMAEYVTVPEKAVFDIGNLPFEYGSLTEPLSCVLHGVERSRIKLGDKVLIFGAGPIGILLLKTILLRGASEVTQVDKNKSRLELAKKSGATHVTETIDELRNDAYDVVIDASGAMFLWEQAVNFVRNSGTILYFGLPRKDAVLTLPAFVVFTKELYLVTSYTSVRNSIQAIRLLQSGKLDVKDIISHRLPLEDFVKGVEIIEKGTEGALKIVICPEKQ